MNIHELIRQAKGNDPDALYQLAIAYLNGDKVEKSFDQYKKHLIFSAHLGNANACYDLGKIYIDEENTNEALFYFKAGMRTGDKRCLIMYAKLLLSVDEQKALNILMDAVEEDNEEARQTLCEYFNSIKDYEAANYWRTAGK